MFFIIIFTSKLHKKKYMLILYTIEVLTKKIIFILFLTRYRLTFFVNLEIFLVDSLFLQLRTFGSFLWNF